MSAQALCAFLALAGIAAYVQTVTGFAFGLVMMGFIALFGLLPLPDAAAMVGVLTLVNATQMMLHGGRHHVAWHELRLVLSASLPALVVGYFLLEWLADTRADALRVALGLVIMASSLQLAVQRKSLDRPSTDRSFVGFGIVSGIMGGLFSTGGPPLVYHFYRQPMPVARIRETLVAAFGTAQVVRLSLVAATGNIPPPSTLAGVAAVPIVMVLTYAARRWPPPLPDKVLKMIVFVLLFLSGLSLALPAALRLLAG
ncbi:MAG: sulfite exporter TauE/SafE family protein [Mesorhizobium sp.]|nr:sulfite exporter TauE/SafE family protein [Mesorhizobium sp.]MBN9242373.1 sulfite exporter TauE/SafE family protein [Mesorhizobium sp.]